MVPSESTLAPGPAIQLKTRPAFDLTDAEFFALCQANRDLRFERDREGDVLIMSPTGGDTGRRGAWITAHLVMWTIADGSGTAFDSSTGFRLPEGSVRSPDAAWVTNERYAALSESDRQGFVPICPDFVIELRSPSDGLANLEAKMAGYIENGARLAWLIDPESRRVQVYRPDSAPEWLDAAASLSGDPELPGFVLPLDAIWSSAV